MLDEELVWLEVWNADGVMKNVEKLVLLFEGLERRKRDGVCHSETRHVKIRYFWLRPGPGLRCFQVAGIDLKSHGNFCLEELCLVGKLR